MKQSKEHIAKRVATRMANNSYAKNGWKDFGKYGGIYGIKTRFKKGSTPWNKGKKKEINIKIIKKLYFNDKQSTYDISKMFNVSQKTIENRLKENGIKLRDKSIKTNLVINKIKIARTKQITPIKDTSIEIKIQNYLKQLNISFFTHQYIKDIKHGYQCDILIPSINLIIECDGNYWHKYPIGKDIDHIRTKELFEKGFKVLRLWESEIKVMTINEFNNKIMEYL